jgi:hypothetical protein
MIECPRCVEKNGKGGRYKYIMCHACMKELNEEDDDFTQRVQENSIQIRWSNPKILDNDDDEWNRKRKKL